MGLVSDQGELEHYHGQLRMVDPNRKVVADRLDQAQYPQYLAEQDEPGSYLKSPYYRPLGYPAGMYRVGPLARINVIERCGTPRADAELDEFRGLKRGAELSSFYYHYARLIEMLFALEKLQELTSQPQALDTRVRARARPNRLKGVGVAEAPRGTLIHHYRIDEHGLVTWANLITATGHNNLAMNQGILQVAKHFVDGNHLQEGMLNRVEVVIRSFDSCLSCATHAVGQMPLEVRLLGADGKLLDRQSRR